MKGRRSWEFRGKGDGGTSIEPILCCCFCKKRINR